MQFGGKHANRTSVRGAVVGAALAGTLLAMPGAAQAKTFNARFDDPSGDSTSDARDIVSGRVAYNRKTGALSATVEVGADFADESQDAVVVVMVSDLVNGKCRKGVLSMGGLLSDPSVPVAWKGATGSGKQHLGSGTLDGSVYSMRVKAKGLAGLTPGCTMIAITQRDKPYSLLDQTAENNGFA